MMLKEGICWRWWYGVSEKPPRRGRESISVGVDFWILDFGFGLFCAVGGGVANAASNHVGTPIVYVARPSVVGPHSTAAHAPWPTGATAPAAAAPTPPPYYNATIPLPSSANSQ